MKYLDMILRYANIFAYCERYSIGNEIIFEILSSIFTKFFFYSSLDSLREDEPLYTLLCSHVFGLPHTQKKKLRVKLE